MGVATRCGCKEVFIILIPTPLVSVLFYSSIPTFSPLVSVLFYSSIPTFCSYSGVIHLFDWKSAVEHDGV